MEFSSPGNSLNINEAYVSWFGSWAEIRAGQQIVKWSNSDFFRTQDRMNPRNDLFRSFDDTDRDLGNIMLKINLRPSALLDIELIYIPFVRPSVLSAGIISMPDMVNIHHLPDLAVNNKVGSLGINSLLHFRNLDWGLSYYNGYNPMPLICFESFDLPQSDEDPPPSLNLRSQVYNISMLATNIEFTAGKSIFRTELSFLRSSLYDDNSTYLPFSEAILTTGMESSTGIISFLIEYQGKYILDFLAAESLPVFPEAASIPPGITPEQLQLATEGQIESFNRMYNYQLNEYNHSLACRISFDKPIQTLHTELNICYNLTTRDLLINPLIKITPYDNLSLLFGTDIFLGEDNSLYDMLNEKLSSIWSGIRINF